MVVAEIPLWVVHSNSSSTTTTSTSSSEQQQQQPSNDKNAATAGGSVGNHHHIDRKQRALNSLALLDNTQIISGGGGASGSNGPMLPSTSASTSATAKAAIYSVDVSRCGTKFVTGGGDGTVRIWNTSALFLNTESTSSSRKSRSKTNNTKPSRMGQYKSTKQKRSADGGDDNNNDDNESLTTLHTNKSVGGGMRGVGDAVYESSGESSMDDNAENSNSSSSSASNKKKKNGQSVPSPSPPPSPPPTKTNTASDEDDMEVDDEVVHDLSNFVRKKKGDVTSPPQNQKQNNTNKNSPTKRQQSMYHYNPHHRLLCTLSAHTGSSVLAVRFSTHGTFLASAGDDAVVCIYAQQSSQSSQLHDTNLLQPNQTQHEQWTRIKVCRGHGLDVVGLAWAPDDSHLVSCSLDSNTPIIVWKLTDIVSSNNNNNNSNGDSTTTQFRNNYSNMLCNPYRILGRGVHTSTVKGVTFDPAGTYLASSGDDPSVCIWRAHDDWGLEKRIDASSGIFRQWNGGSSGTNNSKTASSLMGGGGGQDTSSQSLFRRLSWSTDGAYICSTNAVVKNKHVASTISREGWAVSSAKSTSSGAANLVGHKQPIVACRHCPYLLKTTSSVGKDNNNDDDDEDEPEYATLLALGDKRGFVTVWSTKKSRPVFKIQCSETRCTVTDLAWGRVGGLQENHHGDNTTGPQVVSSESDLMLIVSLLDGQVVALRLGVPNEVGPLLTSSEQARVFQLRYGIDLNDMNDAYGGRKLFVGENSGPRLIENALQYSLEQDADDDDPSGGENDDPQNDDDGQEARRRARMTAEEIKANQSETRSTSGKKRIQPLMMQPVGGSPNMSKRQKISNGSNNSNKSKKGPDTLENAMELATKAASGAEAAASQRTQASRSQSQATDGMMVDRSPDRQTPNGDQIQPSMMQQNLQLLSAVQSSPQIPHSTDRIHSVELPVSSRSLAIILEGGNTDKYVADCTNSIRVPEGSAGGAVKCAVLSISKTGQTLWKDQLPGTSCCAIAASKSWLFVGTADGTIQTYGTSPSLGWESGKAFRSHPPFVLGSPIVSLHANNLSHPTSQSQKTELVVVTADGRFGVYSIEPSIRVLYKGSILPAMTHMLLSADMSADVFLPKLARIQLTDTKRLLMLLSLQSVSNRPTNFGDDDGRAVRGGRNDPQLVVGAGGSLQGFVYDVSSELWMRVADSRFILSDFYNTLPMASNRLPGSTTNKKALGPPSSGDIANLTESVRMGASSSSLKRSRRGMSAANALFSQTSSETDGSAPCNDIASRSHCEDRMACALALGSSDEFEYWFSMYIKTLAMTGDEPLLRMVVDMLTGKSAETDPTSDANDSCTCWWLSNTDRVLKFDRVQLVKTVVIPEMSKNRSLQRYTNEVNIEVNTL